MRVGINMKVIVLVLFVVMIASFGIASGMFYSPTNFSIFGNSNTYTIDEEESFEVEELQEISIEVSSQNITIIPVEGSSMKLHYHGSVVSTSEEIIPVMTTNSRGKFLDVTIQQRSNNTTGIGRSDLKLDVYLPEDYNHILRLRTSSGEIAIGKLILDELELTASSGDLKAEFIETNIIRVHTSSGKVTMNVIETEIISQKSSSGSVEIGYLTTEEAYLESSSGRINIESLKASMLQHRASSGELKIQSVEVEKGSISSSSGDITLLNNKGELTIASSSGDVLLEFLEFENDLKIATSSGKVNVKLPKGSEFMANLFTNSGKLNMDFPITLELREINNKQIRGVVGNDAYKVDVATSSGDISINEM